MLVLQFLLNASRSNRTPTQQSTPLPTGVPPAQPAKRDQARQRSRQPTTTTPPLWRPGRPLMLFGFLFTRDFLDWYCTVNKVGPVRTEQQRFTTDTVAFDKIRFDAKLRKSDCKTVYTGEDEPNDLALCLVIGTNYTEQDRKRPDEAMIQSVQAAMGVNMVPMWYHMY